MYGRFLALLVSFAVLPPVKGEPLSEAKPERIAPARAIESYWNDLADADAAKAYRAIGALTKTPRGTITYLVGKLKPAARPDLLRLERLIDELNDATFAVREKAQRELIKLGGLAESALRNRLKNNVSLETRRRIEKLIDGLSEPPTLPDDLRAVRAVETLEYIGSDAARALLSRYAAGAPGARLTQEASDAIVRLRRAKK
jgi:hypothetical protein